MQAPPLEKDGEEPGYEANDLLDTDSSIGN